MIRIGAEKDFDAVNSLRLEVNALHVKGEPQIFKGFTEPMQEYLKEYFDSANKILLVYEENGIVCGYAMLEIVEKPERPHAYASKFLHIEELGVAKNFRGKGIGRSLIAKTKEIAREKGLSEVELDVWAFNESAVKFYHDLGFETYRELLRLKV